MLYSNSLLKLSHLPCEPVILREERLCIIYENKEGSQQRCLVEDGMVGWMKQWVGGRGWREGGMVDRQMEEWRHEQRNEETEEWRGVGRLEGGMDGQENGEMEGCWEERLPHKIPGLPYARATSNGSDTHS